MQSRFIALMLVALLAATCVVAEEKVEPVGEGGDAPEEPELDAEGEAKAELTKIDTDKDGKATLAEITAYMKAEFYGPEAIAEEKLSPEDVDKKAAKEYLNELDTNKDSNLDLGEIKKHYEYTDEEDTTEGEEGGAEPDTPEDDAGDEASEAG